MIATQIGESLEQWALVLKTSENQLAREEDTTLSLYESSIATMRAQIRELAAKNREMSTALVTVESQHREIATVYTAEITALQEEVNTSKAAVESMREEMLETMQNAHKMVQAALSEKEDAVKAATELADARVAAAKLEFEAELQMKMKEQREGLVSHVNFLGSQVSYYVDNIVTFYANQGITISNPWIGHTKNLVKADLDRLKGRG